QSQDFTEVSTPEIYGENALVTVPHHIGGGLLFDIGGGFCVWGNPGIGLWDSHFRDNPQAALPAGDPQPPQVNFPRTATASTGDMSHSSNAIHIQAVWMLPLTDKFELAAIVGPSFFHVSQDLVGNLTTVEGPPPFTSVSISSVQLNSSSKWATG